MSSIRSTAARAALALSARSNIRLSQQTRFNTVGCKDAEELLYEGPFASLTTRLKTVSISTAIMGAIGVPVLIHLYTGDISAGGQYAVGGTAVLCACGSTVAMDFAFSPYIHTLHRIPVRKCGSPGAQETENLEDKAAQKYLLKATTRNIFAMRRETVFDPAVDVKPYSGIRPFCNFIANQTPLYIHPHLLKDDELRLQLVGEAKEEISEQKPRKDDDDELI